MSFTGFPDHLQGWFDQFWVLRWSAYNFSKWFGFPVSPFSAFVLDVVLIISSFVIFFWVRGVVRLIKYRRQVREEFQK